MLAEQAGVQNHQELIHRFKEGLDYEIARRAIERAPEGNINAWIMAARVANEVYRMEVDYHSRHRRASAYRNLPPPRKPWPNNSNGTGPNTSKRDPNAMDVDALEATLQNLQIEEDSIEDNESSYEEPQEDIPNDTETNVEELVSRRVSQVLNEILTPQQKAALRNRQCYNCGETGHYAKNCRKPKRSNLLRPAAAKITQNKPPLPPRKFNGNRQQFRKQQFTKINEAIQDLDDDEEVAELYQQHADNQSATSQTIADFVSDD